MLVPYQVTVSLLDGGFKLNQIQQETFVESLELNEETNEYIVSGFAKENSKWLGEQGLDDED